MPKRISQLSWGVPRQPEEVVGEMPPVPEVWIWVWLLFWVAVWLHSFSV